MQHGYLGVVAPLVRYSNWKQCDLYNFRAIDY